jgi:hypothetical protein
MSDAKHTLKAALDELGVTMESTFVPWSESRSYERGAPVTKRSLNWRVTLKRNDREILTTDYFAGTGHAPSYKQGRITLDDEAKLIHETERGTKASLLSNANFITGRGPIVPDICDVVACLVSDASAIDCRSFEDWAGDLGYDTDSRKAEATYRACLETGLALRASLGNAGFAKLQTACEGY